MITVYSYDKCSTCRKALQWLDEHQIAYQLKEIKVEHPTAAEMKALMQANGWSLRKVFNTSGQLYREKGLKDQLDRLEVDEALDILVSDGMLMRRPIVVEGNRATVGFNEEEYESMWK